MNEIEVYRTEGTRFLLKMANKPKREFSVICVNPKNKKDRFSLATYDNIDDAIARINLAIRQLKD